jgi:hypothetical protein
VSADPTDDGNPAENNNTNDDFTEDSMITGRMMRPPWAPGATLMLLLLSATSFAQAASASTAALTNEDVVKMATGGFGTQVIEAKIEQARAVDFRLEIDDLTKLKAAGVSQNVISAMLKRAAGPDPAATDGPLGSRATDFAPNGVPVYSDIGRVKLITSDHGSVDLRAMGGSMSTTFAYVTTLIHANFPGVKADVRSQDRRPTLLIKSPNSPRGHFYLVSADSDSKNGVRSVKLGNSRLFGVKNMGAPDSDNQITYDAVAEGANAWRLTPMKDLRPGEYGLWSSMTELYDFGVDP